MSAKILSVGLAAFAVLFSVLASLVPIASMEPTPGLLQQLYLTGFILQGGLYRPPDESTGPFPGAGVLFVMLYTVVLSGSLIAFSGTTRERSSRLIFGMVGCAMILTVFGIVTALFLSLAALSPSTTAFVGPGVTYGFSAGILAGISGLVGFFEIK